MRLSMPQPESASKLVRDLHGCGVSFSIVYLELGNGLASGVEQVDQPIFGRLDLNTERRIEKIGLVLFGRDDVVVFGIDHRAFGWGLREADALAGR